LLSTRWMNKHRPHWARLNELVTRAGTGGVSALTHSELQELGLLYRQSASDLSATREDVASRPLANYLNQLLGRAHNLIYTGRRGSPLGVFRFYRETYPQIFRDTFNYTFAAFLVFFVTTLFGILLCLHDPAFPRYLLGPSMMDTIERQKMWTDSVVAMKPLASSAIMTNNIVVCFTAFALGLTAGIGTLYMMAFNGLLFGTVIAACWQAAMTGKILSFVAAHGALEFPSIFIAGGAGLLLARSLLFPGYLSRRDSMVRYGGQAVRLVLGTIPLLIVAGIVEGFISPTDLAPKFKYMLAAVLFTALVLYLGLGGRKPATAAATSDKT
jgi:uncharacterized membrane protein SpoIIM required for sporulation